ncbi:MAPEG family protein [Comamonas sp. NLF-1-9]|uniref:MAPEG family protein n=1 Tax=Comamonas sp. NLF-1-9 TaxID=2853163 RepID=UPI001C46DE23|nr:MAPEG family protein [Comamonas sp. NLF-1-9]QXL83691.1 MAPEG family protein [Comamonas sp. NLF-1-9]
MNLIHTVALLAVAEYIVFSALVGRARVRGHVMAPSTSGDEAFNRAFRVQQNTLEQIVAFLPALLLAGQYFSPALVAGIGAVWLLGRLLYRQQYVKNPASRAPGFILTLLPTVVLLLMALWGALGLALAR